jgi:hypothetical protein
MTSKKQRTTKSLAKCGLDITQHQLLFLYYAVLLIATEFYSTKIFILNFKIKNQQQFPADGSMNTRTSPSLERCKPFYLYA